MRSERNISNLFNVTQNDKKYTVYYKRNFYAFRGDEFDPSDVEIVFEGGSSGNERFTPEEYTIIGNLNKYFKENNSEIIIYNASTDGKTTRGYVNDFLYWFPKIPNFNPKFFIFYIGINDRKFQYEHYDFKFAKKRSKKLRDYIKNNSIILEMIKKIEYRGKGFWDTFDGKRRLSFIDGGSLGVNMPTADPMAIRTSAYVVNPGDTNRSSRENFSMEVKLIADLFHPKNPIFDDVYEDHGALKQAARIIAEISTAERIILNQQDKSEYKNMDSIYLHGPLVWPAGRYSDVRSSDPNADMFPRLRQGVYGELIPHIKSTTVDTHKRHFIPSYLEILKFITKQNFTK